MDSIKIKNKLINELRNNINEIDNELIQLLSNRLEKARQIIKIKEEIGESAYSPDREREILNGLFKNSSRLLNKSFIEEIYSLIFDESKSLAKRKENPFSLTFYLSNDKAIKRFNQLPEYITHDFKFVLAFDDPSLDIKNQIINKSDKISYMFFSGNYTELSLLKDKPDYIVPKYFHNFCDESQRLYAEYTNKHNCSLVLRFGNGLYIKEFVDALDKYLSILETPPAILAERNAVQISEFSDEINPEGVISSLPGSNATLFKDVCYLNKESEILNAAKAAYASGSYSVIADLTKLTNASIQSIIEFCQVLNRLQ